MKKMRIPLLIALSVAVIGIIFGSLFDYQISKAIASPTNDFGLAISALGPTIAFAAVAAMGGGFVALIIKGDYKIIYKVLFGILAAACYVVSIIYPGGEWFGINGFYNPEIKWLGYVLVAFPEAAAMFGGYMLFKDIENKNMWIVFCAVIVTLCIVLIAIISGLKGILHRPRFRLLIETTKVGFHNWWEPCKEYQHLIDTYGFASDNFKSYPSGHTAEASILIVASTAYPLVNKKLAKIQLPLFFASCGVVALVAFARILAAAHFLSDVSTGATAMILFAYILNEILVHVKPVHMAEE